jgi:hypothetical protein
MWHYANLETAVQKASFRPETERTKGDNSGAFKSYPKINSIRINATVAFKQ